MGAAGDAVDFYGRELHFVADFLDRGGDDGGGILRVTKFEMHAPANVLQLEHGASPGGTGDGNLHGLGAELGVSGEKRFASTEQDGGVAMMHGLNFENGIGRKFVEEDAAFDLRLDDAAVHFVSEVGMRAEHTNVSA